MYNALGHAAHRPPRDERAGFAAQTAAASGARYSGPERRRADGGITQWLRGMIDEIDYGMVLLDSATRVLHANHAAQAELQDGYPLCLVGRELGVQVLADAAPLSQALEGARQGRRKLLLLGTPQQRVCVSVAPLPGGAILLMLGKRQVCERLSLQGFARGMNLTPTETLVLELLCDGLRPNEIAARQGVAVSTVRTHVGSIRAKTGVASIRELVRQVAVLPPMVSALKCAALPLPVGQLLSLAPARAA